MPKQCHVKDTGALILDKCPWWMGSGWHTFPTGAQKWEGKADEKCQLQAGGRPGLLVPTQHFHMAVEVASVTCPDIPIHQGASGASRGGGGGWWGVGRLSSAWDRMAPPRGCDRNWVWAPPPELQILLLMLEKMFPHYSHSLSLSFSFSHYSHPLIPTLFSDLKGEA